MEHFLDKPGKGRPGFGKPGKGNGKRPKAPCNGKQNIENCSCEDGGFFIIYHETPILLTNIIQDLTQSKISVTTVANVRIL